MSWDDLSPCAWTELPATQKSLSYSQSLEHVQSLVQMEGHQFCIAFLECFERHYDLWNKGYKHLDVSPRALMVYSSGGKTLVVLADCDLALMNEDVRGPGLAGASAFIGLDTYKESRYKLKGWPQTYASDAASFLWTLLWIAQQYDAGKIRSPPRLREWAGRRDPDVARRIRFMSVHHGRVPVTPAHRRSSQLLATLSMELRERWEHKPERYTWRVPPPPFTLREVFDHVRGIYARKMHAAYDPTTHEFLRLVRLSEAARYPTYIPLQTTSVRRLRPSCHYPQI